MERNMPLFARRADWATTLNLLTQLLEKKRKQGEPILDLTESNPTRCGFEYLDERLLKPLCDPKNLVYEPNPHGLLEAREAICLYYANRGIPVEPEQLFLTASTSEAYSFLFRLLLNPGEAVLAPNPSYPLLDYLTALNDTHLDFYSLEYKKGWAVAVESLEQAFKQKPKAVVVVNPNNPTGNFVTEKESIKIVRLCRDQQTAVISDEVFLDFPLHDDLTAGSLPAGRQGPAKIGSFAASNPEVLTFVLSGISKILGLPQMKLSWIVVSGPKELRQAAIEKLEIIADTYLSANTPSQHALPAWLSKCHLISTEILRRLRGNRASLLKIFSGHPDIQILKADGGWYAVLQMDSNLNDEAVARRLLETENVLVHPGYFYNFKEAHFLVISLLPKTDLFKEGIERLADCDILINKHH